MSNLIKSDIFKNFYNRIGGNPLETLILNYPNKPWNWNSLSENPNITAKIIETFPNKPWNWDILSESPFLTIKVVVKLKEKPWNWKKLSSNCCFKMKDIEQNISLKWNWNELSKNPNLTIEFLKIHKEFPLNWCEVSKNPAITVRIIAENNYIPWIMMIFTNQNPNCNLKEIAKYPDLNWDWNLISNKNDFDFSVLDKISHKPLNWNLLTLKKNLTLDIIERYIDKPWNFNILSKWVPLYFIQMYPHVKWNTDVIFEREDLTVDFIEQNINKCNWKVLSKNKFNFSYFNEPERIILQFREIFKRDVNCYNTDIIDMIQKYLG